MRNLVSPIFVASREECGKQAVIFLSARRFWICATLQARYLLQATESAGSRRYVFKRVPVLDLRNFASPITCCKPRRARAVNYVWLCFRISSVGLLKLITRYRPRRVREAAAAARFFDDDARNLYGAYLRNKKRKYAPRVPEACLMAAREISGVRAKKMAQMREWRCAPLVRNKNTCDPLLELRFAP